MRLYAFQGLRYDRAAEEIDRLAAPPYDQIDDRLRDQLHAVSEHQFTHLTRPQPGEAGDPYREASRLHGAWLSGGVVLREERPALYPYSIELAGGGRRLGVCGLAGLEDPASGVIRPHEETLAKPLADRVALLEAMQVDLEPVLLLADDDGALDRLLAEDVDSGAPVAVHTDAAGNRHVVYRLEDPARIARYHEALEKRPAAIADGHHRYKTAWLYSRQAGAEPGTAAAAKMAVVTSLASPGLAIDPIHRALLAPLDLEALASLALERESTDARGGRELAAAVADAPQPALGIQPAAGRAEIWRLDPGKAPAAVPEGARDLTVALLHGMLLPAAGYAPESATDGTVVYRSDPATLARELGEGALAVGLYLPPMTPAAFAAAIAHGDMLPPKSTRFLPKVYSGLVWADHRADLG